MGFNLEFKGLIERVLFISTLIAEKTISVLFFIFTYCSVVYSPFDA